MFLEWTKQRSHTSHGERQKGTPPKWIGSKVFLLFIYDVKFPGCIMSVQALHPTSRAHLHIFRINPLA
eukprot:3646944-Amphidinium_carterae.1